MNIRSIKASFLRPIILEEQVQYSATSEQSQHVRIQLASGGSISTRIQVEWDTSAQPYFDHLDTRSPERCSPRVLSEDEIEADSGSLDLWLNAQAAAQLFPQLVKCLPLPQIAVLLATTRLVGVKCPGLHSLYSELDLSATASRECTTFNYEVTRFDKRFRLVFMKVVAPGMTGTVKAFVRPAPQEQPSYLKLKEQVDGNEFAGQRALVIGGCRGLGEVAAKLLCAGGANVIITYYQGKEDARRIVDEIVANGGAADLFHSDVLNPKRDLLDSSVSNWCPTHLYYFATPFISQGVKGSFSTELFSSFCDYYVIGLVHTVNQLRSQGLRNVFYPSTVFIDELPVRLGEYAVAKMAGEMVCTFLEKTNREMTMYRPRLPRMATDQTASLLPVSNEDPVPIMREHLRSFRDSTTPRS